MVFLAEEVFLKILIIEQFTIFYFFLSSANVKLLSLANFTAWTYLSNSLKNVEGIACVGES